MDLRLNTDLIGAYNSPAQQVSVMTEDWVRRNMYCPLCGMPSLTAFEANRSVADFFSKTVGKSSN